MQLQKVARSRRKEGKWKGKGSEERVRDGMERARRKEELKARHSRRGTSTHSELMNECWPNWLGPASVT